MKSGILVLFIILVFIGCGRQKNKNIKEKFRADTFKKDTFSETNHYIPVNPEKEDTTVAIGCIPKDTVTLSGIKIHYLNHKGEIQIKWGNHLFSRTYDSVYTCKYDQRGQVWDFIPKYICETKSKLVFVNVLWTSGGGNPLPIEGYAIVLPKNNRDKPFEKLFWIDCIGDYLVYGNDNNNSILHVLNIETNKSQVITLNPPPATLRSPTSYNKDVKIDSGIFYIKYEAFNKNDNYSHFVKRKYTLKI